MKKALSVFMALLIVFSVFSVSCAETRKVILFTLFKITENGETYRAYDINKLSMYLYPDDNSAEIYGVLFDDEKTEDLSWEFTGDDAIDLHIGETTYRFDITEDEDGHSNLTVTSGERTVIYMLQPTIDEIVAAETEPPALTTKSSEDMNSILGKECPVESILWTNSAVRYTFDGKARYRFDTDYGRFVYTMDLVTGEVLEKSEPDMEAARAQEGFREPLTMAKVDEIVFGICPVEASSADNIKLARNASGIWEYTIETMYGSFYYAVDGYTGEILDKVEPDMDKALEEMGYDEPLNSDRALTIAEEASPLTFDDITGRKVGKEGAGVFVVTLSSIYGEFVYKIDQKTGEIIDKSEPEIGERPADSRKLTDTGEGLTLAEKAFPLDSGAILSRKVNRGDGTVWTVTLGTAYGDFIYKIDPVEGKIIEATEPDMEAARSQEGFKEPLDTDAVLRIAEEACPAGFADITDRKLTHRSDNTWEITLVTADASYFYTIDGLTGEILDSVIPDGAPAETESSDPFGEAIDAVFASFENFDYTAENIKVAMTKKDGKDAVEVSLDWKGVNYVKYYIIEDKTLAD